MKHTGNVISYQCQRYHTCTAQNHRMVKVRRDLWCDLVHLLKQGHLQKVSKDHVQTAFEYLQERRFHNLPGHPVPVLSDLHIEKVLSDAQTEAPMFQFVPTASCPVTGHN